MDQATRSLFLGTGWAFPPEFTAANALHKGARMVSYEEDIRQSLHVLFSTQPGERVMRPGYGCGLRMRVFDSIDATTLTEIRDLIERAVLFCEPRITLEEVEVAEQDATAGLILIRVLYTIRTTNTRSNMVYPFYYLENAEAG
ncbi:MAG TPA: GPW/gp25 family protein [Bryobacteraceae bacterium]|jgi:hypothetical protein|nr:GPW/gp25 family protein [Bryobacteraceae bacterium]